MYNKARNDFSSFFHYICINPTVSNAIFDNASPITLFHFSFTCRAAHRAVTSYIPLTFDINRHFTRFFPDPRSFRSLQACTGAVVSGSNALQFFDRTVYHDSDLDLYVETQYAQTVGRWLVRAGYVYTPPNPGEDLDFETRIEDRLHMENGLRQRLLEDWNCITMFPPSHSRPYRNHGISTVNNFLKEVDGKEGKEVRKVQVITTWFTPLESILHFHSTCVMNLISWEKAYSLFPRATFEDRRTFLCPTGRRFGEDEVKAVAKYVTRGWTIARAVTWGKPAPSLYIDQLRHLEDRASWTLRLSLDGLDLPAYLYARRAGVGGAPTQPHDNLAAHSFKIVKAAYGCGQDAKVEYEVLSPYSFRWSYVIEDKALLGLVQSAINEMDMLGRIEPSGSDENEPDLELCDAELNRFCQTYHERQDAVRWGKERFERSIWVDF